MNVKINSKSISSTHTIIAAFSASGKLSSQVKSYCRQEGIEYKLVDDFKAKANQKRFGISKNGNIVIFLGLGEAKSLSEVAMVFRKAGVNKKQRLGKSVVLDLRTYKAGKGSLSEDLLAQAAVNGLLLSTYNIGLYKTKDKNIHPLLGRGASVNVLVNNPSESRKGAKLGKAMAETQMSIYDLVNAPGNKAKPSDLANWAKASGKKHNYKVTVFNKNKIKQLGLDALLAVNRGSEYPPAFIIMEYKPKKASKNLKTVGLVGKGVTFDTGGLSIKGSDRMHYMKSDMGGAAAVFGTMELAAKMQLNVHLVGIVPSTDNCVDATSVKPGDVIGSYSGKSIEVIDTDAEGRLILADGLAYMTTKYKPEYIVDLATLTGSAVRALGYQAAALFTNNDALAKKLEEAGNQSGERVWRMPLWDAYKKDIESDVADVKNYSGRPVAGAISAAKFLEVFTNEHKGWVHLDIAGAAFGDTGFSKQKSATAYGVGLLFEFLKSHCC